MKDKTIHEVFQSFNRPPNMVILMQRTPSYKTEKPSTEFVQKPNLHCEKIIL